MRYTQGVFPALSVFFCFSVFMLVFSDCSRNNAVGELDEQVYVSVNGEPLTESGLRAIVPPDFYDRLTPEHKANIINEWIRNELLYQEALKEGIDKEPDIRRLLIQSQQQLLSTELLERRLAGIPRISESDLKAYYQENSELFRLQSNEYKIRFALFDNKADANSFMLKVRRGGSFSELAGESSKDPSSQNGGDIGVVNEDLVEPSIWEGIISTKAKYGLDHVSDTFTVIDGWACIIIDEMFEAGTIKPYQYVRELVSDMYVAERREQARENLMNQLIAGADIQRNSAVR